MMFYFEPLALADLSARALVLSLISGAEAGPQSIARLINAAALFGIEASALRVAVARLIKEGLLESPDRGVYMPGPRARALTRRLQDWQNVRRKLAPWKGDWLIALTHHLGRSDRKQLRARERALMITGFRETPTAIWVRPANLTASLTGLRSDLLALGADEALTLLRASDVEAEDTHAWPALWSPDILAANYAAAMRAMQQSLARLPGQPADAAARETLLIGQAVLRLINRDPLLPAELGNQADFLLMVDQMRAYNETGQKCWRDYYAAAG
jgi:phenylacetic acid degradation operon negative regulatory protein